MPEFVFRLFVDGRDPQPSLEALNTLTALCRKHLMGRYQIRAVDIGASPLVAKHYDIAQAPALVREQPLPSVQVVGDLRDAQALLPLLRAETH